MKHTLAFTLRKGHTLHSMHLISKHSKEILIHMKGKVRYIHTHMRFQAGMHYNLEPSLNTSVEVTRT